MTVIDEQELPVDHRHLMAIANAVIEAEGYPVDTEVSITLVDDDQIARHHLEALGVEGPTDVLSFPLEMFIPGRAPVRPENGPPVHLGDVLLAPGYIQAQAAEYEVSFLSEISLLTVHGILHLMGYDHLDDDDAALMEAREQAILADFGFEHR